MRSLFLCGEKDLLESSSAVVSEVPAAFWNLNTLHNLDVFWIDACHCLQKENAALTNCLSPPHAFENSASSVESLASSPKLSNLPCLHAYAETFQGH
jgi:hypothetical protein